MAPLHKRAGSGAAVASHSPSADTTVPLQRTELIKTLVLAANARCRERSTKGVDPNSVSEKGLAASSGTSTPLHSCCMAARTAAMFDRADARPGRAPVSLLVSAVDGSSPRRCRPAASRRAFVEFTLPGPTPPTDRENPLLDTMMTSSKTGHSVAVTLTSVAVEPIAVPSAPVRLQETAAA